MSTTTKEDADIYALYRSLLSSGARGVLATVVRTTGSTYRRAGARMLVAEDGRSAGLISGGCLENDLRERSADVFEAGTPVLVTYDSTSEDDILWGLGLGCTGIAHVLLERVAGTETCATLEFIEECRRLRHGGAIATAYAGAGVEGTPGLHRRVLVREGGLPGNEAAGDALDAALTKGCARALQAKKSSHLSVPAPRGTAEAFVEYVSPPVPFYVFGAGPDAAPLVRLAKELGWHVTVVDWRPAYLSHASFLTADERVLAHPGELREAIAVPRGAVAVIMTHNFTSDVEIAGILLSSAASYIGLLGPRAKADLVLEKLAGEGVLPTDEDLARFHSPVGLDIGSETPEEIALAIAAEIQAIIHERPGSPLRLREGPIHA